MVFTIELLWLFIAAMVISSIGFKHYIWFISIGYGFAIAGEGLLMLILFRQELSLGTLLCCLLLTHCVKILCVDSACALCHIHSHKCHCRPRIWIGCGCFHHIIGCRRCQGGDRKNLLATGKCDTIKSDIVLHTKEMLI